MDLLSCTNAYTMFYQATSLNAVGLNKVEGKYFGILTTLLSILISIAMIEYFINPIELYRSNRTGIKKNKKIQKLKEILIMEKK